VEPRRSHRRAKPNADEDTAAALLPTRPTLMSLRRAAAGCTACELFRDATQTVFGEGGREAALMLVGEQPGDREDREGRPFVGPAGRLLEEPCERPRGQPEGGMFWLRRNRFVGSYAVLTCTNRSQVAPG
jgi:Uracil DNA glycosylase superfamily